MNTAIVEEQLVLGLGMAGILMTPEEFDSVEDYDPGYRYELIHGVLVVNPIPSEAEADPNEELGHLLRSYREQHPQGAALDLSLSERYVHSLDSRRRADRVIWAGLGRMPDSSVDVPTIAIEFVSAGKRSRERDYIAKRGEYYAAGVKEYWIIDRFQRCMTVHIHDASGSRMRTVREAEIYQTPLLPGFELPLSRLLAVADKWKQR